MNGWKPILVRHFRIASLMIIDDLDAFRRAFAPDEADSTLGVAAQRLQPASWNCPHVLQFLGVVQHPKLPPRTLQPRGPEVSAPRSEEHTSELQSLRHLVC